MIDPIQVMTNALMEILTPIVIDLRSHGWDAGIELHQDEPGERKVCIAVTLRVRVPIEQAALADPASGETP